MKKRFIAALTAAAVTLSTPGVSSAQETVVPSESASSPEAVISAAFFGTGPLAEGVLRVVLPEEVSQEEYDTMVEEAVDLMTETDPEAVEDITEGLTSGSPLKVEQALEDGTDLMVEIAGDDGQVTPDSPCGFAAVCVAVAAAVALSVVVAQNSAVATTAAAVSQAIWLHIGAGTSVPLEHEQAIAELTRQLAA